MPASAETVLPDQTEATISVIGDGDGAVVFVSVTADEAVEIDSGRPAQLQVGERWREVPAVDPPTTQRIDGRVRTSTSYRVSPDAARLLARGGDVRMKLSIGGMWRTVTARRIDVLE